MTRILRSGKLLLLREGEDEIMEEYDQGSRRLFFEDALLWIDGTKIEGKSIIYPKIYLHIIVNIY